MAWELKTQLLSSFGILALIWIVQIHIYPMFLSVRSKDFIEYEKQHISRISLLVLPLFAAELISFVALTLSSQGPLNQKQLWMIGTCMLIGWLTTFLLSAPLHDKLSQNYSKKNITLLINTNWIRTIAWTAKSILLFNYI